MGKMSDLDIIKDESYQKFMAGECGVWSAVQLMVGEGMPELDAWEYTEDWSNEMESLKNENKISKKQGG